MPITFSIEPQSSDKLQELANYIATYEGFYKDGTLAQRNNNPGNLKYVTWSTRKSGLDSRGFAIYNNPEDGFADLMDFLHSKAEANYTLAQLMHIYAPSVENDTNSYIYYLADQLGVSTNVLLSDL